MTNRDAQTRERDLMQRYEGVGPELTKAEMDELRGYLNAEYPRHDRPRKA